MRILLLTKRISTQVGKYIPEIVVYKIYRNKQKIYNLGCPFCEL